jgi:hypothetical protein
VSAERDLGMAHRPVRVVLARGVQLYARYVPFWA